MRTTMDAAGRVVIPKPLRAKLGLTGGEPLEIVERDGVLEITPATADVSLVDRDGLPVAVPDEPLEPLTDEAVRAALEQSRR